MEMSILAVDNLVKTYGDKTLFDHISFTISEKQRIGLIGVNGTGKSTLLKVLSGEDSAEQGSIQHANDFHAEYLPQDPSFDRDITVLDYIYGGDSAIMVALRDYENALQGLEREPDSEQEQSRFLKAQQSMDTAHAWEAESDAKTILTKLGITQFSERVQALSGGQKKRVALARTLIQPADLLILDEPTNHLDNETIEWLEEYLTTYPGALLVVTHDRYFLNRVTNRIYELDKGKLYVYEGNYETFLEKKAEREEQAIASDAKHRNQLRRELAWLRRGAKARSTKQKARVDRVHEMKEKKEFVKHQDVDLAIGSTRLGKEVIEMKDVSKGFGEKQLIHHFSYLIVPRERLGIIGANGSGKTTLLNMMAGRIQPDSGIIEVGQTVKLGYYTQEHVEMDENLRIIDYIKEQAQIMTTADGQTVTVEQMLERFLFPRSMQYTYIRKLSGGERKRLYLLRVLMEEPNVLFLDEPTNDLDTETLAVLEDYLEQFPGVVITVSHDRYFLDRVVNHLIAFEGNGVIRRFEGDYTDYLQVRKEEINAEQRAKQMDVNQKLNEKSSRTTTKKKLKLSYKEQQEWNGLEDKIAHLEQRLEDLQNAIIEAGSDAGKVQELFHEQQETEAALEKAMERWEELSLLIEEIEKQKS